MYMGRSRNVETHVVLPLHLRVYIGVVLALALAACATQAPRQSKDNPPKTPVAKQADVHVAKAHAFEHDKAQVKSKLARNENTALSPNEVGYYLDILQGRFKQAGVGQVVGGGFDRIVLDLTGTIDFVAAKSPRGAESYRRMSTIAGILREYRKTLISVRVVAETDNRHDMQLAQARAREMANYLVRAGVSAKRIIIVAIKPAKSGRPPATSVHVELQVEPIVHRAG